MMEVRNGVVRGTSCDVGDGSAAAWQRNWRRVASTHSLQDLLEADSPPDPDAPLCFKSILAGGACILLGSVYVIGMPFWIVGSKLLHKPTSAGLLRWLQEDKYYGPLVVLTIPVALAAVFLHWLALKLFKHNY